MDLTKLYKTQISLSEWFEKSGHSLTKEMRVEDNEKRERLKILNNVIGLPFDKPFQFSALEIANKTENFSKFLEEHGSELCALRLIPIQDGLPKLRMRGHSVNDVLKWFEEQKIDLDKYRADFVQHPEKTTWSTIFIVNEKGIFGEIVRGSHAQLTQGYYELEKPITFFFDFKEVKLQPEDKEATAHILDIISRIKVDNEIKQAELLKQLDSKFYNNYIGGYFETTSSDEFGLWFIDYNRILGDLYSNYSIKLDYYEDKSRISGLTGFSGKFIGKARIVKSEDIGKINLSKEDILVCEMTSPEYVNLMKNAGAIVTDLGGILSHAAIIAREFKVPCLVGTGKATKEFSNGDLIEVDAENGFARKIS